MGQITSLFIWKVIGIVDDSIDRHAVLRSIGIDPESPVDPGCMVEDTVYYDFLARLASLDPSGTTLPLRAGASMRCDDYGVFGLAWKSAANLRGSYDRAERYARVLTSVARYEVETTDRGALMHLHRSGERHLGMRLSNEATIASIVSISREVATKGFDPVAVYFRHPPPRSMADHERYFGCPVHFGADMDALWVSQTSLQTPNRLGDASISKFFETHLETELDKAQRDDSLDMRLRDQVSRSLSEGVPLISDIATSLGMSARTLQRRLAEEGVSYQALVEETRRRLAESLLQQTDYALAEIAFMTGFSEQSAFTRAFKRWQGQTPRAYRIGARS
ncbi:MAG TPA: AraC family transcriptional regulator [Gammaproteobacteria bacterium]|nr:AraC family transcriptional regulator [Gammaproteobacteria bacterium]